MNESNVRSWTILIHWRLFVPLLGLLVALGLVGYEGLTPNYHALHDWIDRLLFAVLFLLFAYDAWRARTAEVQETAVAEVPIGTSDEAVTEASPASTDVLRLAYAEASKEAERLRQRAQAAATAGPRGPVPGEPEARQLVPMIEELCRLAVGAVDPVTVERWQERGARLQGAVAQASAHPPELRAAPPSPHEWSEAHPAEAPLDYLEHLVAHRRKLLAEVAERERPERPAAIDWRKIAEDLELQLAMLERSGRVTTLPVRPLHERLLDLLGCEEIAPRDGDPIDRQLHQIEVQRPSREMAPNRVLRVIAPGLRVRGGGEVKRRAIVEMSEQVVA